MNILVFPCSSGIGQEIFNALDMHKEINLYGMNDGDDNIGKGLYKNYIKAEYSINNSNFIVYLEKVIQIYKIDAIFPAYDDVQLFLRKYYKGNCKIITSELNTCEICRSKNKTYDLFENYIMVPKRYNINEAHALLKNVDSIFIKPDIGQGSQRCYKINTLSEFQEKYDSKKDIIMEYLTGDEFTIDCLTNKNGILLFCKGRIRKLTRNGLSIITESCNDYNDKFNKIALIINSKLKFKGAWFFQLKLNNKNELVLLEIAPRIAGAMCLYRQIGINFPLLSIFIEFDKQIDIHYIQSNSLNIKCYKIVNNYITHNLHYDNIYCDLDDTLIIHNKVNHKLLSVLYCQLNKGKNIYLITRHILNPVDTLNKYKIHENLFTDIIWIRDKNIKKAHKMNNYSMLIDDSFEERKHCHNIDHKYAIDNDSIEFLN